MPTHYQLNYELKMHGRSIKAENKEEKETTFKSFIYNLTWCFLSKIVFKCQKIELNLKDYLYWFDKERAKSIIEQKYNISKHIHIFCLQK